MFFFKKAVVKANHLNEMETNNINLAKAIDFINEWTINYYTQDKSEKPDPYKIQEELWKLHGIDYNYFEHAFRIMKAEGYIEYLSSNESDTLISAFRHTDKGLLLYLNGGLTQKIQSDRIDKELAQRQVQSVISTNTTQKIVLVLTTLFAIFSLFLSWLAYNKTDEVKILTPIQVHNTDTIKVFELYNMHNDTVKMKK